jgi:hypothetical protein
MYSSPSLNIILFFFFGAYFIHLQIFVALIFFSMDFDHLSYSKQNLQLLFILTIILFITKYSLNIYLIFYNFIFEIR